MSKQKKEVITIRVPVVIMDKIRAEAETEMRYYTEQINEIFKNWYKKNDTV